MAGANPKRPSRAAATTSVAAAAIADAVEAAAASTPGPEPTNADLANVEAEADLAKAEAKAAEEAAAKDIDGTELIDDRSAPAPAEAAILQQLHGEEEAAWGRMSERERRVLSLRFGLEDGRSHTLEEVGRELGVIRETVRRIECRALDQFRPSGWRAVHYPRRR